MLGKLIKWDLMADWKKYSVLYAATLIVSVMLVATGKIKEKIINNRMLEIIEVMFGTLFMTLIVSIVIVVVGFTVTRFYKNVMRDEGYLTHTLPVPTWQILVSKLIVSYIWFLSAAIVGAVCLGIAMGEPLWLFDAIGDFEEFMSEILSSQEKSTVVFLTATIIISVVLSPFFLMSHAYFCFALGNLSSSHKLGLAVLAFFGLNIAENILATAVMGFLTPDSVDVVWTDETIPPVQVYEMVNKTTLTILILSVLISVGLFIAAERIFTKKLNLE